MVLLYCIANLIVFHTVLSMYEINDNINIICNKLFKYFGKRV